MSAKDIASQMRCRATALLDTQINDCLENINSWMVSLSSIMNIKKSMIGCRTDKQIKGLIEDFTDFYYSKRNIYSYVNAGYETRRHSKSSKRGKSGKRNKSSKNDNESNSDVSDSDNISDSESDNNNDHHASNKHKSTTNRSINDNIFGSNGEEEDVMDILRLAVEKEHGSSKMNNFTKSALQTMLDQEKEQQDLMNRMNERRKNLEKQEQQEVPRSKIRFSGSFGVDEDDNESNDENDDNDNNEVEIEVDESNENKEVEIEVKENDNSDKDQSDHASSNIDQFDQKMKALLNRSNVNIEPPKGAQTPPGYKKRHQFDRPIIPPLKLNEPLISNTTNNNSEYIKCETAPDISGVFLNLTVDQRKKLLKNWEHFAVTKADAEAKKRTLTPEEREKIIIDELNDFYINYALERGFEVEVDEKGTILKVEKIKKTKQQVTQ